MKQLYVALLLLYALALQAQSPAILDNSFGTNGSNIFMVENSVLSYGKDVTVLPDGGIIMSNVYNSGTYYKIALSKFHANGNPDSTFGTNGIASISLGNQSSINGMRNNILVDSDGKIYVTGFGRGPSAQDMFLCRFLPDGTPDTGFGTGGGIFINILPTANLLDACNSIAIQDGNRIYMAGATRTASASASYNAAIAKIKLDGICDSVFTADGRETYDVTASQQDYAMGIALQNDGKIVLGGYTGTSIDLFFIRINADGSRDVSYNNNTGILKIDVFGATKTDNAIEMISQSDGKVLMVGNALNAANIAQSFVVRVSADGTIDNTFGGGDGIVQFDFSTNLGASTLNSILALADGKYLCVGNALNNLQKDFVIARLLADGSLDLTFNYTGYCLLDASGLSVDDESFGIALQTDGKIVTSGTMTLTPGSSTRCYISRIIPDVPVASFTQNINSVCEGFNVQYSGLGSLNTTQWHWEFEGGIPAISTDASPLVTYNTTGDYQVMLIASNATFSDTLVIENCIVVDPLPSAPAVISGPTYICNQSPVTYNIEPVANATSYSWLVTPSTAGTLIANGLSATFTPLGYFIGAVTISVYSVNDCGNSQATMLNGQVSPPPTVFQFSGPGYYCEGTTGQTILLSGSQLLINYELYLDNSATGNIKQGTGSALSWNELTGQGFYSVQASNGCMVAMAGQVYNEMHNLPTQASTPTGENSVCNSKTGTYATTEVPNTTSYEWELTPANAGIIYPSGLQASIYWNNTFSGSAGLSVKAVNECGAGPVSGSFTILVYQSPIPVITGLSEVCNNWNSPYTTQANTGSVYEWSVNGGIILSGSGSNSVTIQWNSLGVGVLSVQETSAMGCTTVSEQFIAMISPCTGLNDSKLVEPFSVYPNPANQQIHLINIPSAFQPDELIFTDQTGRVLKKEKIIAFAEKDVFNIAWLKAGFYYIQIKAENGSIIKCKLIKE